MLNIIEYFFSISYMPMHGLLKRIYAKKYKSKKNQNALYMIASVSSRRYGSYRMYFEGDSPHQIVMIVCELKYRHLCNLVMFFTHNMQYSLLLLIHVQVQYDLIITRNTCVNTCSLNCLNLFLKYKIGQTCLVCVCFGSKCLNFFFDF